MFLGLTKEVTGVYYTSLVGRGGKLSRASRVKRPGGRIPATMRNLRPRNNLRIAERPQETQRVEGALHVPSAASFDSGGASAGRTSRPTRRATPRSRSSTSSAGSPTPLPTSARAKRTGIGRAATTTTPAPSRGPATSTRSPATSTTPPGRCSARPSSTPSPTATRPAIGPTRLPIADCRYLTADS